MTIIVAYADPARAVTWLGCDTQTYQDDIAEHVGPKWIMHGEWAIASSGSLRANNLIAHHAGKLFCDTLEPVQIATRIRDMLVDDGYERIEKGGSMHFDAAFLLARPGRVWSIDAAFAVVASREPYMAEGCGRELALGAFHATKGYNLSGEQQVRAALEAAVAYQVFCGGELWAEPLRALPLVGCAA